MNTDIKLSPKSPEAPGGGTVEIEKNTADAAEAEQPTDEVVEDGSESVAITTVTNEKPKDNADQLGEIEDVVSNEASPSTDANEVSADLDSPSKEDNGTTTEEEPSQPGGEDGDAGGNDEAARPAHKKSPHVADLRTPEGEQAKREAAEARERALADQAEKSAHIAVNNADTVKPPTTAQESSFDLDNDVMSGQTKPEPAAGQAAIISDKPAKKPGFFARLFGKK